MFAYICFTIKPKILENNKTFMTGYFGNNKRHTKVHVVDENRKPICGTVIGKDMEFQWNSMTIYIPYIECSKCKKKAMEATVKHLNRTWNEGGHKGGLTRLLEVKIK